MLSTLNKILFPEKNIKTTELFNKNTELFNKNEIDTSVVEIQEIDDTHVLFKPDKNSEAYPIHKDLLKSPNNWLKEFDQKKLVVDSADVEKAKELASLKRFGFDNSKTVVSSQTALSGIYFYKPCLIEMRN